MQQQPNRKPESQRPRGCRDLWEFIIKLIIALLVIAWFVKEYLQRKELDPFTLIILLIILAVIVWLILHQRHFVLLECSLTGPSGCVRGENTTLPPKILEIVEGTAGGWGFDHYILELRDPAANLLSNVVIYPGGGGTPDIVRTQGDFAVSSGTLGWIDLEKAAQDAGFVLLTSTTFEITLRVFGVDGSEKAPPCRITFELSINEVYIKRVSTPWSVHYSTVNEQLRTSNSDVSPLATIGGGMHVRGAANVRGCATEKIREYTIWVIPDPSHSFAQPPPLSALPPIPASWVQITHIVYTPIVTSDGNSYTLDQVIDRNTLDGRPQPEVLTNVWGEVDECFCILIDGVICLLPCPKVPTLIPSAFDSDGGPLVPGKLSALHVRGTGKFTFLLQVIDSDGNTYYDVQRAWIDNEPIHALIAGIAGLAPCTDLYTKTTAGAFKTVNVEGTAWDQLIDPDTPNPTKPTSDNFGSYQVYFNKQGAASGRVKIKDSIDTCPPRPGAVGIGTLVAWNLTSLDATANSALPPASQLPADQLLVTGESCTYDVILETGDLTVVNEGTNHSSGTITFPIKIINDKEPV